MPPSCLGLHAETESVLQLDEYTMAIREDLVASAAQFLQDPSVASSPIENRISFLRNKNLTQEEIDAALARAGGFTGPNESAPHPHASAQPPPPPQYYPQYAQPSPWLQPPPQVPKRDWRDWFIMATMVGGLGYGLYTVTKRYVYPMIAPPTPDRLEQDKKDISEQFDKTFGLVEQLARDTEALKAAEQDRTERLDTALSELESVMNELKSANRRREDDAQRLRDEIQALKEALPAALESQKTTADNRLKEVNSELLSLKTLISRMNTQTVTTAAPATQSRQINGNVNGHDAEPAKASVTQESPVSEEATPAPVAVAPKGNDGSSGSGSSTGKVSIPAWQLAMANKGDADAGSSS
ncbi:hypothetical protein jhhlp_000205 [Lomentospora prolificans]|uniref:Peroxisomal membrane protein PEX14 n=1 Tax=Lomentospora prolificans TaxID=41688 RepID=A0A2N3NK85_9PEZI|nr:hypothetical protein jhhlp_000205 [Lomentospora prolificans]